MTAAPLPVRIDDLQRTLAEVATPADAATLADQAAALHDIARRANLGLRAQNEAAALRLHAERRLGEMLADTVTTGRAAGPQLEPLGITRDRSSRAQKLARIPQDDFTTFLANTMATEREITQTAALKLLPTTTKPQRAAHNPWDNYVAPPVDTELAHRLNHDTSSSLAELIASSITSALQHMENRRHAYVWAKYHGLNDDGTLGETWSHGGIATAMGTSREYVESVYYRADSQVWRRMSLDLLQALKQLTTTE